MRLPNLITVAKVANTALDVSGDGFFLTAGAVRKGGRIHFVFSMRKWEDTTIEDSLEAIFKVKDRKPDIRTFPNGYGSAEEGGFSPN